MGSQMLNTVLYSYFFFYSLMWVRRRKKKDDGIQRMRSEIWEIASNICKSLNVKVTESQVVSEQGHFMG